MAVTGAPRQEEKLLAKVGPWWLMTPERVVPARRPRVDSSTGPRSTLWPFWPRNDGSSANPATGTVTMPPMTAPRPSVAPSRNRLRGNFSPGSGGGIAASPTVAGGAAATSAGVASRTSAVTVGTERRISDVAPRAQRKPKTIAMAAPIVATHSGLTISPTSATAMPTAKPSGQMAGDGPCSGPGVIPSSLIRP